LIPRDIFAIQHESQKHNNEDLLLVYTRSWKKKNN
jgi:hypothetical protein